jgi:predicted ATPase
VGARGFDLLLALVEREGALVTKEQLLERAWPGLVVEEANVHVQVSQLRKLIGAEAIATVAGLGYRFACALQRDAGTAAPRQNLPAERTLFVGREAALAEAQTRLMATRLLSLVGMGGTGKTRLAIKLAERALAAHADGVCWIDLTSLDVAEQLARTTAHLLGLTLATDAAADAALAAALRERSMLLVFDNGEHMLDALAALADTLLAGAPRLRLLVTSREALGIAGESVLPVRPLALPGADASAAAIGASEAVQLFAERAAQVAPGFALDDGNAVTVAGLCRHVDGIPLALELAAAQLRVVSPEQLLALLGQRFDLLARQQRRALPRQQTLQAVIQWSFDRLAPAEQQLLCALSVCSGGCDLAAAAALVGQGAASASLLLGLAQLVEQSLLAVHQGDAGARYRLLETVRQFALDRLIERGDADAVRLRHARHSLAVAEGHDEQIARHGQGAAALAMLDLDRDNLLRALDGCQGGDAERAAVGLRLANALRYYWPARGLNALGVDVTRAALANAAAYPPDLTQSRALAVLTQAFWRMGRHAEALAHARRHVALAGAIDDPVGLTLAHTNLGDIERSLDHLDAAQAELDTALRIATAHGDAALLAHPLHGLASVAIARGAVAEADRRFAELLAMRRRQGHGYNLMTALLNAASAAVGCGDIARAKAHLREAAPLQARVGSRLIGQYLIEFSAVCLLHDGDAVRAVRLFAASLTQRTQTNLPLADQLSLDRLRRDLQRAREQLGEDAFEAAWAEGVGLDHEAALARSCESLRE